MHSDPIIVGAGPAGLTLSAALRQRGVSHRLIDRLEAPLPWSRAMGVQARTLELLDRLGLAEAVLARAVPLTGYAFHLKSGERRIAFAGVHPRFPAMAILPQAEIEAILGTAVAPVERGVRLAGADVNGPADLIDAAGAAARLHPRWVAGCDGAHSRVRDGAGEAFEGRQYDADVVLADVAVTGLEPGYFHVFVAQSMIAFAAPGGLWRLVTVVTKDPPADDPLAPFRRPGLSFGEPVWTSRFRISQRQVQRMRHGNLLLLGDAAHVHSPAGGQGMNIGMQDAWWLAEAIADGSDAALDRWARERRRVAKGVLKATDRLTRSMLGGPGWLAALRELSIGLMARHPSMGKRLEADLAGLAYPPIHENHPFGR